tara:strand:- start:89 stop:688 length:600 start_codon:yes stop_codon:yes gene_type:complete
MRKNNFYIVIALLIFSSSIYPSQIWKSFILPGWGEKSLNNNVKGDAHLLSDLILFSSVFFCGNQYETYRNDYRIYGSDNAGVNWYGKNDLFAAHVGNYNSMEEFNNQQLLNFGPSAFTYSGESYYWDWNSDSVIRNQYDTWRNKSELYDEAKGFLIAGMLLNRIISMINVLSIEKENKIESNFYYNNNNNMNFQINYKF